MVTVTRYGTRNWAVWLDGELFSGKPDLEALAKAAYPDLNDEERKFLDGPVAQVCAMTDDWRVHQERDLPKEVWDFLKRERFFGLVIPKEYGIPSSKGSRPIAAISSKWSRPSMTNEFA